MCEEVGIDPSRWVVSLIDKHFYERQVKYFVTSSVGFHQVGKNFVANTLGGPVRPENSALESQLPADLDRLGDFAEVPLCREVAASAILDGVNASPILDMFDRAGQLWPVLAEAVAQAGRGWGKAAVRARLLPLLAASAPYGADPEGSPQLLRQALASHDDIARDLFHRLALAGGALAHWVAWYSEEAQDRDWFAPYPAAVLAHRPVTPQQLRRIDPQQLAALLRAARQHDRVDNFLPTAFASVLPLTSDHRAFDATGMLSWDGSNPSTRAAVDVLAAVVGSPPGPFAAGVGPVPPLGEYATVAADCLAEIPRDQRMASLETYVDLALRSTRSGRVDHGQAVLTAVADRLSSSDREVVLAAMAVALTGGRTVMATRGSDRGEANWLAYVEVTVAVLALAVSILSTMLSAQASAGVPVQQSVQPPETPAGKVKPLTAADMLTAAAVPDATVHYVFLVDTSVSMGDQQFSTPIRNQVSDFARHRRPNDHVSVVGYDLKLWFTWDSRTQDPNAISALPAVARGSKTDIGAALATAVDLAKTDGTSAMTVFVLLTDGENIPGDDSAYKQPAGQTPPSASWTELAKHVTGLGSQRPFYAFGYALGAPGQPVRGQFDPLVRQVLPGMLATEALLIDELRDRFTKLPSAVRSLRSSDALRAGVASGIVLSWPGDAARLSAGANKVVLELRGQGLKVPVSLSAIRVGSDNDRFTVTVDPQPVQVRPGQAARLPATISWTPGKSTRLPWREVSDGYRLQLTAAADLSFLAAIDPRVSGPSATTTIETSIAGNGSTQLGQPLLWGLAGLSALVALWCGFRWIRLGLVTSGRLVGTGTGEDGTAATLVDMKLRRWPWPARKRVRFGGRRGRVRAHAVSGGQLRVDYTPDGTSQRRVNRRLSRDAPHMINGVMFHWHPKP